MLFFSRKKKKPISEKTVKLKDVREVKHVLVLFKALDKPEPHFCFLAFRMNYVGSQEPNENAKQYYNELKRLRSEKSDNGYAVANNKTSKLSCYRGDLKPKHVPSDYKSKRMDENTLTATIHNFESKFTKKHHGMLFSMIRSGFFGNGYEKMIPEDYIAMLDNHNISHQNKRSTLYRYLDEGMDYLSYSFDIKKFDDDIMSLRDTDYNKRIKYDKDIKFCSKIIDDYWQRIT